MSKETKYEYLLCLEDPHTKQLKPKKLKIISNQSPAVLKSCFSIQKFSPFLTDIKSIKATNLNPVLVLQFLAQHLDTTVQVLLKKKTKKKNTTKHLPQQDYLMSKIKLQRTRVTTNMCMCGKKSTRASVIRSHT